MFDPIIHASIIFVYATIGLAVALWRLVKLMVLAVAGATLTVLFERECDRAGVYQTEGESDEFTGQASVQEPITKP